jgi:hypothetical protein
MDLGLLHSRNSTVAACAMAKHLHYIGINKIKVLVSNSYSEEFRLSNPFLIVYVTPDIMISASRTEA